MRFQAKSGRTLHYRTRGIGRPVLLLHPVGLRGDFWAEVVARLEDVCRPIYPDFPGHGESDAPHAPLSLADMAQDMADLLRTLAGPALVVGCSMGGMTAQAMAATTPDVVTGVIVANTAHLRNDAGRAAMEQRAQDAIQGMPATIETTLKRWFDADYRLRAPEKVALMREWLLEADPVVHSWCWRAIRDLDFAPALRRLTIPAMAVAGVGDQSTPVAAMREMAADIPNCLYREIESGHLSPLEQPEAFAACVREML